MKHLLSVNDLDHQTAIELLNLGLEMKSVNSREVKKLPALNGKTIANLFFEDSTRTRVSFEIAAKRLSADVVNITAKGSSVSKGESLKDTVMTLEAMGIDALVIRHSQSGAAQTVADSTWSKSVVVNAGDGTHEHPTQALLDAMTMRERLKGVTDTGDLAGVRVLIVGDILHSRVARSNAFLLKKLGAYVAFAGPRTLVTATTGRVADVIYNNLDDALADGFDVVMMLRIQMERMSSSFVPNSNEYTALYGLTEARFKSLNAKSLIMHPGPMNRGLEIASEVADSDLSAITQQVTNGVSIRMAVLYRLLAQENTDK